MKIIYLSLLSVAILGLANAKAERVKEGAKVTLEAYAPFFFKEVDLIWYYSKNFYFIKGDAQGLKLFNAFGMSIRWTTSAYPMTVVAVDNQIKDRPNLHAALIQFDKDVDPVWVNTTCLDNPETEETADTITDRP